MIYYITGHKYLLMAAAKQMEENGFSYQPNLFITRPDVLNGNFKEDKCIHIDTATCLYSIDFKSHMEGGEKIKVLPHDWTFVLLLNPEKKNRKANDPEGLLGISTNEWETLKADIISALSATYQDDEPSEFDVVKDAAELSVAATFVRQRAKELDREGETDDNRDEVESHAMLLIAKTIRFLVEQGYYDYD